MAPARGASASDGKPVVACLVKEYHVTNRMPERNTLLEKEKQLRRVARELATKSLCPLRKTAKNAVPGEGSANAQILFLGEAPGRKENETGRPFVGAAGKVLDKLLASIKLERAAVFITSIEKFRPPENRDPKPDEVMACFPYLQKQIEIIQPKFIVTLGRHALRRMIEWSDAESSAPPSIEQLHGKVMVTKAGYRIFPVHHPAAMLYNRKLTAVIEQDFKTLSKLLKKKTKPT